MPSGGADNDHHMSNLEEFFRRAVFIQPISQAFRFPRLQIP